MHFAIRNLGCGAAYTFLFGDNRKKQEIILQVRTNILTNANAQAYKHNINSNAFCEVSIRLKNAIEESGNNKQLKEAYQAWVDSPTENNWNKIGIEATKLEQTFPAAVNALRNLNEDPILKHYRKHG